MYLTARPADPRFFFFIAALFCLVFLFPADISPADAESADPDTAVGRSAVFLHAEALATLREGNFARTLELLESLRRAPEIDAATGHLIYLEGLILRQLDRPAEAAERWREYLSLTPEPLLGAYAGFHLAELLEADGDSIAAADLFEAAAKTGGRQWPRERHAMAAAVRCWARGGRCERAADFLSSLRWKKGRTLARRAEIEAIRCLVGCGDESAAKARIERILGERQTDDASLEAYRLFGMLEEQSAGGLVSLFSSERVKLWYLGNVAYNNRLFEEAKTHLSKLLNLPWKSADPYQDKAMFLLGRCSMKEGRFDEARTWFDRVGSEFPRSLKGQDGLFYRAVCDMRTGDDGEALQRLTSLAEGSYLQPVGLKAARSAVYLLKKKGDTESIAAMAERIGQLGGEPSHRGQALFHLADVKRRSGKTESASDTMRRVSRVLPSSGGERAEARFWLARLEAVEGHVGEAIQLCHQLSRERAPYLFFHEARLLASRLVSERFPGQQQSALEGARLLLERGDEEDAREELEKFLMMGQGSDRYQVGVNLLQELYRRRPPHKTPFLVELLFPSDLLRAAGSGAVGDGLRRAAALIRIGQYGDAAGELGLSATQSSLDPADVEYSMALYSLAGGRYATSIRRTERLLESLPPSFNIDVLPLQIRLLLYPGHYYQLVQREAALAGIDPLLILAVIREESRFDPEARSPAAARGLMQILPSTAADVAGKAFPEYPGPDALYDPETSIRIGAAYLASLLNQFDGNVAAALAAYNGGEDNAARWLRSLEDASDPLEYIREITFSETRRYVIKVLSSYRAYSVLGEKLVGNGSEIVKSFIDWDGLAADLPLTARSGFEDR